MSVETGYLLSDYAEFLEIVIPYGYQKLKVGMYAGAPYAFVAQIEARNTGQILEFGPPPATGANKPLSAFSTGVMNPVGLAVPSTVPPPYPQHRNGHHAAVGPGLPKRLTLQGFDDESVLLGSASTTVPSGNCE